jgi:TetR/AcrR family transcriptional regulator, tetracycline repressor protein
MVLRREGYVHAALELLEEVGLDGLSLRRLGDKLGVQGPALYAHFTNKQELLDRMAEVMIDDALAPLDERAGVDEWEPWLAERARTIRRTLLAHRDGARLHAGSRPTKSSPMSPLVKPLVSAGFSEQDAVHTILTISRYTLGCAVDEQPRDGSWTQTEQHGDPDASFEFGLRQIIAGLRAQLHAETAGPVRKRRPR